MTKYSYRPCKPNEIKPLDMTEDELRVIRRNADELNEWYEEELNRIDED